MEFWIDIVGSTIFLTKEIFKNNSKEITVSSVKKMNGRFFSIVRRSTVIR